jgi:hypothetical protein
VASAQISLVGCPRIPPCVVASLRFGLAPSLISNFASKTGDFARSCPLSKTSSDRIRIATFLQPLSYPAIFPGFLLVGIPPSTRFHEVSVGYCPSPHPLHRLPHTTSSPAVVIAGAIEPCPRPLKPRSRCPRSPRARGPIASQLALARPGCPACVAEFKADRAAHPPHTESGEPGMKSAQRVRIAICRAALPRRLCLP